jgi:cell division protein FtsW (lipid II flippase)
VQTAAASLWCNDASCNLWRWMCVFVYMYIIIGIIIIYSCFINVPDSAEEKEIFWMYHNQTIQFCSLFIVYCTWLTEMLVMHVVESLASNSRVIRLEHVRY